MAFDFICHGSGAAFYHVFNAVASFFTGTRFGGTIGVLLFVSTFFAMVILAYQLAMNLNLVVSLKRLVTLFLLVNVISIPRTTVIIKDKITLQTYTVAHVPYVLAALGGLTTQLGDTITRQFDTAFAAAPELAYGVSGVGLSSKILEKASHFTIPNPDMAINMQNFVKTCVVFNGIAKGRYTFQELFVQEDIWKFVAEHTSPRFGFLYRPLDGGRPEFMSCQQIAKKLDEEWPRVLREASQIYGQRIFAGNKSAAKQLAQYLGVSYQYLTNLSVDASLILRQNMMLNAIQQGAVQGMAFHDSSAGLQAYALTRASRTQETAWALMGKLANYTLTPLKIVIEVLFYGIFPIVAILAPLPGGLSIVKTYVIALFWIQSWGPLYAILNMILNVYGQHASLASLASMGKPVLCLATLGALGEANSTVVAISNATIPMIPFLSFALFRYGAGALTQLAQTLTSTSSSAVSAAADEVTTGRLSLATTSFDTHSMHNISGFKTDTNLALRSGTVSFQENDGGITSYHRDGNVVLDQSPAISRTGTELRMTDEIRSSFERGAEKAHHSAVLDAIAMQTSINSGLKKIHDFREARGDQFNLDSSVSQRESVSTDSAIMKADEMVNSFARDNHIGVEASRKALSSVAVSASVGMKIPGTDIGFGGETSIKTEDGRTMTAEELVSRAVKFDESEHFSETLRAATEEAKALDERTGQSQGKDYVTGLSADFSQAKTQENSTNASLSREQAYREAAGYVESHGVSIAQDLNQDYVNFLRAKVGGTKEARQILSDPVRNNQYLSEFIEEYREKILAKFHHQAPHGATLEAIEKNHDQNKAVIQGSSSVETGFDDGSNLVREQAKTAGLTEPLQPTLTGTVNDKINDAKAKINQSKVELVDTRSQELTKHENQEKEVIKKILD